MKKVTKAAVAAGAAGALLLGGAGTFALWNGSGEVDAGSVSTGHLNLNVSPAGTWADISTDAVSASFVPATDKLVPGDTVTYTQTVSIDADGKNLKGTLVVGDLVDGTTPLPSGVSVGVVPAVDPLNADLSVDESTVTFAKPGSYDVDVTVTVAFAKNETESTDQTIDLGKLTLSLNQVR